METSEILGRHHQRLVALFIESVLDQMALGDLERNVVGVALVPGIVAVQTVFHAADAEVLGRDLPDWLDRVSSVMPDEAAFMAEMGRRLDPAGYDLLVENLGGQARGVGGSEGI